MKNLKVVGEKGRNFVRIPREFFKEKRAPSKLSLWDLNLFKPVQ